MNNAEQVGIPPQIIADRGFWQIVGDWFADIASQQVPGSIVLLIIAVAFAPYIFRAIMAWFSRGANK